jgi:hypothetical protein
LRTVSFAAATAFACTRRRLHFRSPAIGCAHAAPAIRTRARRCLCTLDPRPAAGAAAHRCVFVSPGGSLLARARHGLPRSRLRPRWFSTATAPWLAALVVAPARPERCARTCLGPRGRLPRSGLARGRACTCARACSLEPSAAVLGRVRSTVPALDRLRTRTPIDSLPVQPRARPTACSRALTVNGARALTRPCPPVLAVAYTCRRCLLRLPCAGYPDACVCERAVAR